MSRHPKEITDDHLRQIALMAGWGMTEEKIAAAIGISRRTLQRRKRDSVRVEAALFRGMSVAESYVGEALLKKARQGDVSAIKLWYNLNTDRTTERQSADVVHRDYRQQVDEARAAIRLVA